MFLRGAVLGAVGLAAAGEEKETEEVSTVEDLMREHGVLKRVLMVYREGMRRIDGNEKLPVEPLAGGAKLIRSFIESYHEKLEEDYLFPRFRKAGKLTDLVDVLTIQHQQGRVVTAHILELANGGAMKEASQRRALRDAMHQFVRMYEPHEAREDTVLFPAFHQLVSRSEYDALGEEFEKKEHQLFGGDGFEKAVDEVARLEKALGIYDLAQFTPKV
jgi:hemerythrin-like domain-containing protein